MKKVFVAFTALLFSLSVLQAQEDGSKLAKAAGKALQAYSIDPNGNGAKLDEAIQKIEEAWKFDDVKASASSLMTRGDIFALAYQRDETENGKAQVAAQLAGKTPEIKYTGENNALTAFEAYKMVLVNPDAKKYQKGDAIKAVKNMQAGLINIGVSKYDKADYAKALTSFEAALESHEILKKDGKESLLDDATRYSNQVYTTALTAAAAGNSTKAYSMYEMIYKKGDAGPEVFTGMYRAKLAQKDTAAAEMLLAEGRKKHPGDAALLFDEINSYLTKGKLNELTGSLKSAIEKEPKNVSLYVTLGNVYDNLYQTESKNKNEAKGKEYFDEAVKYYNQASTIDPKNANAVYSMGALYYNQAALLTQELNAMPDDFTSAGMKKYNAVKDKITGLFDQALPFFKKAEGIDPNDLNTVIALSEIFARKEDADLTKEFKSRLETLKTGGKVSGAYFK